MDRLEQIVCGDTEYLAQVLRHANVRAMQISRGDFAGTLTRYCISGWNVQHIEFTSGSSTCFGDAPPNTHALLLPLAISRHHKLLGKSVSSSSLGLYAPSSEHADVTVAGTKLVVVVPPPGLTDLFAEVRAFLPSAGSVHATIPDALLGNLRHLLVDFHHSITTDASILDCSEVARGFEDAFLLKLRHIAGSVIQSRPRGRPEHPRPALLRELRETVSRTGGEPIFASELCRQLNISFPTLRRMFLDWFGVPPARYLLLRRYYLVRQRLRDGSYDSVGAAAQSCGFWNPSRFAANYKSLFHELPSATLLPSSRARGGRARTLN